VKITRVEAIPLVVPVSMIGPAPVMFGQQRAVFEFLLVRVETDLGISGYGETLMYCNRPMQVVIEDMIAPLILGQDPADISGLMHRVQRMTHQWGRQGLLMFAISAVDMALWDIAGKAAGVPLYRMLGAAAHRPLTPYASMAPCHTPEVAAEQVRAAVAAGYSHVKLHVAGEAEVRAARRAAGSEVKIIVDANCRWTPSRAAEMAGRLKALDVHWLEEPIFPPEDVRTLARLRRETGIAIAAGENAYTPFEFEAMVAAGAVTYAQPSVIKVGGITEFRKIAALAEAHGVELRPQSFSIGPGFLATMHLLAAQPHPALIERPFCTVAEGDLCGPATRVVDGVMHPPEGPGLGYDPDPELLRAFRAGEGIEQRRAPPQLTASSNGVRKGPSPADRGKMVLGQIIGRLSSYKRFSD
jgi:D-galactarolactone cycloisomerase